MTTAAIVGNLFLLLGAALLIGVAWLFRLARSSRSWASAPGRVISSKIDRSFDMTAPMRMDYRFWSRTNTRSPAAPCLLVVGLAVSNGRIRVE